MTTTAPTTIKAHRQRDINPAPTIPDDSYALSRAESDRMPHGHAVYLVCSTSDPDTVYRVVINARLKLYHCTCTAAQYGRVCVHLRGLLYWLHYAAAFRAYQACDMDELRAYDRQAQWGWTIDRDALGDAIAERLQATGPTT